MGALNQFRQLGGAIGLGILTSVLDHRLQSALALVLSREQFDAIYTAPEAIESLPPDLRAAVSSAFAGGYNLQMRILTGICAAQLLTLIVMWKRTPTLLA